MNLNPSKWSGWVALLLFALASASYSSLRNKTNDVDSMGPTRREGVEADEGVAPEAESADGPELMQAEPTPTPKPAAAKTRTRIDRADAFVAGADWEFDGFVAGGQDSNVRSMFFINDLIYLNIGAQQGIATGDKVGIYKRGDKVRDPQTGKFIGYEVRRAAIAKATDRVDDETCAVRISNTYEAVEIGDLVRVER